MNEQTERKFPWPMFFIIVIVLFCLSIHYFILPLFKMTLNDQHIFSMALLITSIGLYAWAFTFVNIYNTKIIKLISWIIFVLLQVGSTYLYVLSLKKGFVPFPPTGFVAYDYVLLAIFVFVPTIATTWIMKAFKKINAGK